MSDSIDASSLEGTPEAIEWLDQGRLAFGKYALLEGDPSLSKSTIALDIGARGSRGQAMPSGLVHAPFATLVVGVEDGTYDTLVPRAMAAGADRSRIYHLRSVRTEHGREPFTLPGHIPRLEPFFDRLGVRLIVFDPLPSLLDRGLSENNNKDTRQALEPLIDWAQERKVCVVGLRHFTKGGTTNPLYRGQGSIAFAALARQVNQVYADGEGGFVLTSAKNSLGELPPSLAYARESVPFRDLGVADPQGTNSAPRIVWGQQSHLTAKDLSNLAQDGKEERSERAEAEAVLAGCVEGGVTDWKGIMGQARAEGVSEHAMRRARERLGLVPQRDGFGPGSKVTWHRPPPTANGHRPGTIPSGPADTMPFCAWCGLPVDAVAGCRACLGSPTVWKTREELDG